MPVLTEQVDQLFAAWNTPDSPGCVLAVIQDGAIAYSRAYGLADLERQVPLTTDSVLDLGSTGKQFTAALVALLDQQGVLALDDSIQKYLPELPAYSAAITIRHLIHHTSGLRDYTTLMHLANKHFENYYFADELFDLIARQQDVNFPPGAEHLYCNTGYLLLGVIASRATGKPYTSLIREYILEPLGMKATGFNDDFKRVVRNRALAYSPGEDGGFTTDISFCGGYGDGALISTVGDLFLWDQNFYNNRLGKGGQAFIEQLLTPGTLKSGAKLDYAFGLMVGQHKGLRIVSHGGAWAGYRAEMIRFPEQRLSVICLANLANLNPSGMARQVADLYLADQIREAEAPSAPISSEESTLDNRQLLGVYRSRNGGSLAEFTLTEDRLTLGLMGFTFRAEAIDARRLKTTDSLIEIEIVVLGDDAISISLQGMSPTIYRKLGASAAVPEAGDYAGSYYSPELEISYRIVSEDGKPFVKRGYAPREAMTFAAHDLAASSFLIFEFFRDAKGRVGGFKLFADRVVNIHFERQPDKAG